ncbi:MAG: glycosyltransferase [Planctomycetes bacterium]|nr:glycosyltransferase [Planctomycetota bacterium]
MVAIVESILARMAVTLILGATIVASTLGAWFRRLFFLADATATGRPIDIVIIGTFYNDGWFQSHVKPLIECRNIGRIHIVTDQPLAQHDKVCYHCPSRTTRKGLGRTIARLLVLIRLARKQRLALLMGYHIMPNALMALVIARWFWLRAAYQMTGGPIQLIGGGVGSENRLLRRQAVSSRLREALMFAIVRRFDSIIVRGESSRRFIREVAPNVQCDIIPGSIDTDKFNESPADKTYDTIAVGRLVDVKRYDRMLNILAEFKQHRPSFRAAIVGDGPLSARLRVQSITLGIDANVDFLGQRNDVPELLTSARLFLLTSENEDSQSR